MQGLKVEDEVQLAHVLKQFVQGLDVDLYQVDQGERGLGRGGDDDEEQGRVVTVGDEGGDVVVRLGRGVGGAGGGEERRQRKEVARARGPVGYEGEDLGDESLLYASVLLEGGGDGCKG